MSHALFKFSIKIKTDDLAVVHCLRSLAQYSQKKGNVRISWGGTKEKDWERDGNSVTFRFTTAEYRSDFVHHIKRLLPDSAWSEICQSDSDPASPQIKKMSLLHF